MRRALELAVFPTENPTLIEPIIEGLGWWLSFEGQSWRAAIDAGLYQKVPDTNRI